jgi:hypothetical protein
VGSRILPTSWPLIPLRRETAVADEEADELGRVEAAEPAKEIWGDGDAAPTPAHDGGAREASGGREPQDLGEMPVAGPVILEARGDTRIRALEALI